ncbi:MAG: hypothetical protein JWM88_2552 [Verrucomicrobia bacterium]|nr:hypothetical protein [Verrucomicrobiota bacterium]
MHKIYFFIGYLCGTAAGVAAEQILPVNSASVVDWIVTGAQKADLVEAPSLVLPPGAQLSRSFDTGLLVVRLRTTVPFGVAGDNIPTVEAGPVGLAFVQDNAGPQLMLVLGNSAAIPLPFLVKPETSESRTAVVDLELSFERSTGAVTVTSSEETKHYTVEPSIAPVEVVISAGAQDPFPLSVLTVSVVLPDVAAVFGKPARAPGEEARPSDSTLGLENRAATPLLPEFGGEGGGPASQRSKPAPRTGNALLEVYSVPSMPRGRVETVRAAVLHAKKS